MLDGKKLKEKLKAGQVVTSIMLRFPDPSLAEMLAIQGVELVIIDNEHYAFDAQNMQNIIRAVHSAGKLCMVRLPNVEEARIAQVLSAMAGVGKVEVALFYPETTGGFAQSAPTGAVVVAQGAGDLTVRLSLIRAMRTLLGLPETAGGNQEPEL